VTKYAAALAADNYHQDVDKVSAQLGAWALNGKSITQKWSKAPRKQ
jgi:hypothetical protein